MKKSVEKSTDFLILCDFFDVFSRSALLPYDNVYLKTASASNRDSPFL